MIPNNENIPDMEPLANNITPQVRSVGGAASNVRILNDVAQARQALAGGTSIGLSSVGGTPMLSNMISNGITSSIPPSQTVISSAPPSGVASISGPLPVPGAGPVPNSAAAQYISAASNPPINSSLGMMQPLGNIQGSVSLGQTITSTSQGNLPATQMVQNGMSMNQNMMNGSGTSGISSDNGTMMRTPGMSQQGQPGLQPNGVENSNSMTNMPLNQQTSNTRLSTYIKFWEGNLFGRRAGQPVYITRLEGYMNSSASETLVANWPPTMQIVRLISQDQVNNIQYVGRADFLVFQAMNQHGFLFLERVQEKKLCAVIRLPSQTLLLSFTDIAHRLIGMLFPGDLVIFRPSNQQQQLQAQLQQQQLNATAAADPADATAEAEPADATIAATNPANATTATNSTNAAATANGWNRYESIYIQGGGRSQLLSQGQVSSQGPPSISGGGGFMS